MFKGDEIKFAITMCISAIALLFLLGAATTSFSGVSKIIESANSRQESKKIVSEYREYSAYDNTEVSGAQVISFILRNQGGDVGTEVGGKKYTAELRSNGGVKVITLLNDEDDSKFEPDNLNNAIDTLATYKSELLYDANDNVGVVKFTKR